MCAHLNQGQITKHLQMVLDVRSSENELRNPNSLRDRSKMGKLCGKPKVRPASVSQKTSRKPYIDLEILMQNIIQRANEILEPFKDGKGGVPPDPSYVLQFSNEAYMGSNLFAVQKVFDGSFQFDVFFDSKSAKTNLDG